jgi:hypothetical protein
MPSRSRIAVLSLVLGLAWATSLAQTQKIPVTGCSSTVSPAPGLDCAKAYDGNTSTRWGFNAASSQDLQLDFGQVRRIKRIVVTWTAAPYDRSYLCVDGTHTWHLLKVVQSGSLTDDINLAWGTNPRGGGDTLCDAASLIIEVSSSVAGGIQEVSLSGPGSYTEDGLLTVNVPIPAWNMNALDLQCLDLPAGLSPDRVVGISAVIRSDFGTVHNFAKLRDTDFEINGVLGHPDDSQPPSNKVGGGGTVGIGADLPCSKGKWQIFLKQQTGFNGASFTNHPAFSSLATNPRGYVKIEYLNSAPEYP